MFRCLNAPSTSRPSAAGFSEEHPTFEPFELLYKQVRIRLSTAAKGAKVSYRELLVQSGFAIRSNSTSYATRVEVRKR